MQMFQPYATAYGMFLSITSLFFLCKAIKTNMNCFSQCRTEEVSLIPSFPPVRPTSLQPNTGSTSSSSPVHFPVILVQVKLCRSPPTCPGGWGYPSPGAFPLVELWAGLCPSLQPVKVPAKGCTALWGISHSSQLGVVRHTAQEASTLHPMVIH